jgi:hypothetical protein
VIFKNAGVLSRHEFDLGRTHLMGYRIDTGDAASVAEHLRRYARVRKKFLKVKPQQFAEGSAVYVYVPRRIKGRTPKWQCYYKTEGTVVKKLNDVTYVVKSKSWRDGPRIVHADKLKLIRKFGPHGVGENNAEITPTQRDRINSNQN